jgi:hypothetical protein
MLRCVYFGHRASQSFIQRNPMTFELHSACRRCRVPLVMIEGKWKPEGANERDEDEGERKRSAA